MSGRLASVPPKSSTSIALARSNSPCGPAASGASSLPIVARARQRSRKAEAAALRRAVDRERARPRIGEDREPRRVHVNAVRRREIDDPNRRRSRTGTHRLGSARAPAARGGPRAVDAPQRHHAARAVLDPLGEQGVRPARRSASARMSPASTATRSAAARRSIRSRPVQMSRKQRSVSCSASAELDHRASESIVVLRRLSPAIRRDDAAPCDNPFRGR